MLPIPTHNVRLSLAGLLATLCALACGFGCKPGAPSAEGPPTVVATTTMLGDMVTEIAGDAFEVHTIMQPGADPHLYRPTPSDARAVAASDLVVMSGLHLEGWAEDLIENAGGERPLIVAAEPVDVIEMEGFAGGVDPHFWFDVAQWRAATEHVAAGMRTHVPEDARADFDARVDAYLARLDTLDQFVRESIATLPEEARVLVTSHDAFNYFGRAYAMRVVGVQGISTESEASQRDVADVVDLVRETGAPAVFAESSVNPALIQRIGRETGARVAGPLYSDSLGPADGPAGTYEAMVRENVRLIVEALGASPAP